MIYLYLKIPENFVRLILDDGFRVVHIPIHYEFVAPSSVDGLSLELYVSDDRGKKTLLSILAVLYSAVIWMVFISPPIFNSSCLFTKPLGIVTCAQIAIYQKNMCTVFGTRTRLYSGTLLKFAYLWTNYYFSHQFYLIVFHRILKSLLVTRTLLGILADFSCAVVCIDSNLPLIV